MKKRANVLIVVAMAAVLSGCAGAAFNRVNMTSNRHITIGQELIDLKKAHDEGIINDTEYAEAKKQVLSYAKQSSGINLED